MRTLRSIVLSALCFTPTIGWASNVDYQLDNRALQMIFSVRSWLAETSSCDADQSNITVPAEAVPQRIEKPFSPGLVKDRVWDTKGIEERISFAEREGANCFGRDRRTAIDSSPAVARVSDVVDSSDSEVRAPDWIDDGLWPKTKDLLHYTNKPRPLPRVTETILWLGPPVTRTSLITIHD